MAKLFAMENDDAVDMDAVELEESPESGEVSDVMAEVSEDAGETDEIGENIDTGTDAGESLGDVEELLEGAVESGEGLSPIAAEAVRIAIESICARLDADPRRVYSLYATENFQSGSSRLANTKLALEGVGEFLKDLYKKIKAALIKLWKKVTDFWDKHISSLGRVKKAIDSMRKQIKASGNKLKATAKLETMPSSLATAFFPSGELTIADVQKVIASHGDFSTQVGEALRKQKPIQNTSPTDTYNQIFGADIAKTDHSFVDVGGLVGNVKLVVSAKTDKQDDEISVEFEIDRQSEGDDSATDKGMMVPAKEKMLSVLDSIDTTIKATIATRKDYDKTKQQNSKDLEGLENRLNRAVDHVAETDPKNANKIDGNKQSRLRLNALYKVSTFNAKLSTLVASENVRCAKAVLTYMSVCVKQYKA